MNPGTAALTRGLEVLEMLADDEPARTGLRVAQLAQRLDTDRSQMSRTLQTLHEHGFVDRDPETLAYRLGWRVFALAARAGEARLVHEAPPVLRALVRELGESVHLSVRQGTMVLTLLAESPPATLHAPGRVGGLTPIATTSAGRALVSDLDRHELDELGLGHLTRVVDEIGELGYAIVREEFEPGLVAAAAPIFGPGGRVVAALNVSGPRFRFDDRLDEAARRLVVAADGLAGSIGGAPATARGRGLRPAPRPS
ncbi:MAG TPA: IclR family transcriptional regulator [Actinomycetota bacterium]